MQALEHHDALAASEARIQTAEGLRQQAALKPNPRLFLQSENARFSNPPPFLYSRDADSFAYLSQVIELGGKRDRRTDAANEAIRTSELSLQAQRSQIATRVLSAYWAAVGAKRLQDSLADGLENLSRAVQYHRDRVREGSLPEADLIRVELEHQQVAIAFQNAQQDARRSLLHLFLEMGVPPQTDALLTGKLDDAPEIEPPVEDAAENRPDVRLALQGVKHAESMIRLQKANAVPDPEVLAGYKRTGGLDTLIAGVQINLPVRNRNQGAISAAIADQTAATASVRAIRRAADTEIAALTGEFQQKKELVEKMLPALRQQANETSRIAQAVYREGASDLLRLLDAERSRLQAEALYIRSLIEYQQAGVALQSALGRIP